MDNLQLNIDDISVFEYHKMNPMAMKQKITWIFVMDTKRS